MSLKRKLLSAAAIAPFVFALLPASTAHAHGYVSSPASRQAQCAARIVSCGQIQWEPQSVEGPKGLRSCSGGNSRFAELDDDNKGWRVTPVGRSLNLTWHLTVSHATSTWEYYIGSTRVAVFNDGGARPGSTVNHTINLNGYSGKQKLLAVWNIADTANAFYSCIDINVS
ncbi:hypothetical protein GCM10027294_35810 [Marinactinospora endophytica]